MTTQTLTKKEPKQYSIFPLIGIAVVAYFIYAMTTDTVTDNIHVYDAAAARNEMVMLFESNDEPTASIAYWINDKTFAVGVNDDGTQRKGYAEYACQTIEPQGFKDKGIRVHVIDAAKHINNKTIEVLGTAKCK